MKKLVVLAVFLAAFCVNSFAQKNYRGEKGVSSVGVIIGHAVSNKAPTIGIDYRYNIMDKVRLAPSAMYVLKNNHTNTIYANADVHYLARITKEATLYPLAGIGFSHWKWDFIIPAIPGVYEWESETKIRLGLNLGFGGEMRVSQDIIVGAEFRYNLTAERSYDQAMLLARVAYYF